MTSEKPTAEFTAKANNPTPEPSQDEPPTTQQLKEVLEYIVSPDGHGEPTEVG